MAANTRPAIKGKAAYFTEFETTQERLPYWARSTNPIVRRHLGLYWRTIPPEITPYFWILGFWVIALIIGVLVPTLFEFIMISFIASIIIMPFALALYGHVLFTVAIDAANAMQQEFANNTFELLQATPMSLPQIFLGKVAAAIWKRVDDITMIAQLTLAFSPPLVLFLYNNMRQLDENIFFMTPIMGLLVSVVFVIRVFLEPLMIGILSVFIGMVVPGRGRAISSAVVLGAFYFLLINLLSWLPAVGGYTTSEEVIPANFGLVVLTDIILPIALPLIIIFSVLKMAQVMLAQD